MMQEVIVEGMKCEGCAKAVKERFETIKGVEAVSVSLEDKKVSITTRSVIDKAMLKAALAGTKYAVAG